MKCTDQPHYNHTSYFLGPTYAFKTALTCWGMDSEWPLKVSCGIRHQHVSSSSFKSLKLWGRTSMNLAYFCCTFNRCSIGFRSGEFGRQFNTLNSSSCFSNHSVSSVLKSIILLKEAAAIRDCYCLEEVCKAWNSVEVRSICQSNHRNAGSSFTRGK